VGVGFNVAHDRQEIGAPLAPWNGAFSES
jgi:hypothetical protein